MKRKLMSIYRKVKRFLGVSQPKKRKSRTELIADYKQNGSIPWSSGYQQFKEESIINLINDNSVLACFLDRKLPKEIGVGIDERIVEYPWIIANLDQEKKVVLDAGSSLNFSYLVTNEKIKSKDLTMFTFSPESENYSDQRISYVYGDLRDLPFKDGWFDVVTSISTIEHIDMDNSIYGWNSDNKVNNKPVKSYDYMKAIEEYLRVLRSRGTLLLTFPYGKFENHGFFQQFDSEMLNRITGRLNEDGESMVSFIKYTKEGWDFDSQSNVEMSESYNPHTGIGRGKDGAAHSRAICVIRFEKD